MQMYNFLPVRFPLARLVIAALLLLPCFGFLGWSMWPAFAEKKSWLEERHCQSRSNVFRRSGRKRQRTWNG